MGGFLNALKVGTKGSTGVAMAVPGFIFGGSEGAKSGWKGGYNLFKGGSDDNDAMTLFKEYMEKQNKEKQTSSTAQSDLLAIISKMNLSSTEKAKLSQAVMSDTTVNMSVTA